MDIKFSRISEGHDTSLFECTSRPLSEYLKNYALRNDRQNIAKCIVAILDEEVVGFYTTSMMAIAKNDFERKDVRGLPGYPIPVILIGKLAVHRNFSNKGIGSGMLRQIFKAAVASAGASGTPAFRAIIVDVDEGDPNADGFYEKYGFKKFPERKNSLYLPIKTIISAMG